MPSINVYTKEQTDALLPDAAELVPSTTGATQGDVLTVGASGTEWTTPSGGVTKTKITTVTELVTALNSMNIGDTIVGTTFGLSGNMMSRFSMSYTGYDENDNKSFFSGVHFVTNTNLGGAGLYFYLSINNIVGSITSSSVLSGHYRSYSNITTNQTNTITLGDITYLTDVYLIKYS